MSFFNKLRGNMGLEEEKEKEIGKEDLKKIKAKKPAQGGSAPGRKTTVEPEKTPELKPEPKPEPKKETKTLKIESEDQASKEEGQLAIDVYEVEDNIVIQSTIGGVKAEDLDISIEEDMITIRGTRENKIEKEGKKYFYQECYWGSFMRKVILPEEVDASKAKATIKEGILTLTMPKIHRRTKKKISVQQEE
ncbi:MAG: Hsp20/alpha crystallin family protein [Candidatus Nealsonbacteria bacterium]